LEWEIFGRARYGLLQAVQSGTPGFDHVFGHGLFDHLAANPPLGRAFDAEMVEITDRAASSLLDAYSVEGAARIVDIGGGTGAFLAHILRAYPLATGIVLDVPAVADAAKRHLESAGMASRSEAIARDFVRAVPPGDLYLLSHVLHNWNDDTCVQILRKCREHLTGAGRVVAFEVVMPERITRPEPATDMDVAMLALTHGRERTEAEFRDMYAAADLELTRVVPTTSARSVIEGRPRAAP